MKKTIATVLFLILSVLAFADSVRLTLDFSHPYMLVEGNGSSFLRVGLRGMRLPAGTDRPPVNVSIVLDRSGSMSGTSIQQAIQAAITAISQLGDEDIVSVVAYSDGAEVVQPARRVGSIDRRELYRAIQRIQADGSTALYAGVSRGAAEVRRFYQEGRVNRVILLSDGQANIGPSTPWDLGQLGQSLGRIGIPVTTLGLGLGYNEDLMYQLALQSDGNHAFVEYADDLAAIFRSEFDTVFSIVAQNVDIEINFPARIRPLRVLNREAEIYGGRILAHMNQIGADQEKYLLVEVAVLPGRAGERIEAASVHTQYWDAAAGRQISLDASSTMAYTADRAVFYANRNTTALADAALQTAVLVNQEAMRLRDEGRVEDAEELLMTNAVTLEEAATELAAPSLNVYANSNRSQAGAVADNENWDRTRQDMTEDQYGIVNQQVY